MKQEAVMERVGFDFPLAILKQTEEAGNFHIVGYAATSDFDLQGDIITEDALRESSLDLLKNSTVLLNHDITIPIGKVTKAEFDKHGLLIDVLISKTEPDIIQKIKEGVLNKFSIRGQVLEREKKYMAEYDRIVNVIKRMSLVEVSLVSVPANPEARAVGWYVSKALQAHDDSHPSNTKNSEGGETMPKEDVAIEEIPQEKEIPAPEPAAKAKEESPTPSMKEPEPAPEPPAPEPVNKSEEPKPEKKGSGKQFEAVWFLLDRLAGVGGEAANVAVQLKALLGMNPPTLPAPSSVAKGMTKEEVSALVASEVKKSVEIAIGALPAIRKGLIQKDTEPEDIKKQFEALSPEKKLKVALALQQS